MNPSEAMMLLTAFGYGIDCGYVFCGKYRYGRIFEEAFVPEGNSVIPIPWEDIKTFTSSDQGSSGQYLNVIRSDDSSTELKRSELPQINGYSGLKPNPNGQGFLMPYSISDLMNAWRFVFPEFKAQCWKEITTNYIMVNLSLIGETGLKSLDDPMITRIVAYVQDQLQRIGCKGKQPGKDVIRDVLIAQAELNSKNAFIDMMRTKSWDKQPRLDRLFIDVFGAKMRGLSDEESEEVLKDVCKCWFLGAVARQHKAIQLDIIPIMIGATGTRKSSAVRWMATCDDFYRDPLDISEKRFVEDTKGGLVVELAEMKATKGMDNDYLKGFISRSSDHIRLPYDRCASENIRRFVIIGTTNEAEFLSDPTGNRRYFPFEVDPGRSIVGFGEGGFRSDEAKKYILQVWAEAYHRFMSKEKWDLNPRTVQLAKVAQEASTINNPNVDILSELLDDLYPMPGDRVCRKDLEYLLSSNSVAYGEEAAIAANLWMRTPHPEWSGIAAMRINADGHRQWLTKASTTQRCWERIQTPGYKAPAPTHMLGE